MLSARTPCYSSEDKEVGDSKMSCLEEGEKNWDRAQSEESSLIHSDYPMQ